MVDIVVCDVIVICIDCYGSVCFCDGIVENGIIVIIAKYSCIPEADNVEVLDCYVAGCDVYGIKST